MVTDPTLNNIVALMKQQGVSRLYYKELSANDNSKNQVYLGGNFRSLNIFPFKEIVPCEPSQFSKPENQNLKALIDLTWLDSSGNLYPAPKAKLILYSKYPEVRLSGFLNGCKRPKDGLFDHYPKSQRHLILPRVLMLGVTAEQKIIGYVTPTESTLGKELLASNGSPSSGVFIQIALSGSLSPREALYNGISNVYSQGWLKSVKLKSGNIKEPYAASNGVGYTLEAELGITPNGYSEPDFEGWEIKATSLAKGIITLMTPEPDCGYYKKHGASQFVRQFGYPDKSGKPDRINFSSPMRLGTLNANTNLTLMIKGYNSAFPSQFDIDGLIGIYDENQILTAGWTFGKLLEHWNLKHSQAAFVPYEKDKTKKFPHYRYGPELYLGEGTDFTFLLKAISDGKVYYDPGIKLEGASSQNPKVKARSQFRVKFKDLVYLYDKFSKVEPS